MKRTGDLGAGLVEALRGGVREATHRFHAVAVRPDGTRVAWAGDPQRVCFLRSSAKPFQALPLVLEGILDQEGLSEEDLAIVIASHSGQPEHLALVQGLLDKAELRVDDLRCGAHEPFHRPTARRLNGEPTPLHQNCSGQHAGILLACKKKGWPLDAYREPSHPYQRAVLEHVARISGADGGTIRLGIDGCGMPCYAMPLTDMARSFAVLAAPQTDAPTADALLRIRQAMRNHPFLIGGEDRLDTRLAETTQGRLIAKAGAEGLECVAVLDDGDGEPLGVAVKVEDGSARAMGPALGAFLREVGALQKEEWTALADHFEPVLKGPSMDAGVVLTRFV